MGGVRRLLYIGTLRVESLVTCYDSDSCNIYVSLGNWQEKAIEVVNILRRF